MVGCAAHDLISDGDRGRAAHVDSGRRAAFGADHLLDRVLRALDPSFGVHRCKVGFRCIEHEAGAAEAIRRLQHNAHRRVLRLELPERGVLLLDGGADVTFWDTQ